MISTASTGAGLFWPLVVALVAVWLLSLQDGQLPVAPAQPPVQETMLVQIIDVSEENGEEDDVTFKEKLCVRSWGGGRSSWMTPALYSGRAATFA